MRIGIIWDLILVAQIEISRHAINTATQMTKNSALLNFHIAVAVGAVLLFLFMLWSGKQLINGKSHYKPRHITIGIMALVLRTATYLTSFFVVGSQTN